MRKIAFGDLNAVPWKNGGGITREIAIDPPDSSLLKGDFTWRLSAAEIHKQGIFSRFDGFERQLIVWNGSGVELGGSRLSKMIPFRFDGATEINCVPEEKISDLGIIFRAEQVSVGMEVISIESLELQTGTHFLFSTVDGTRIDSETVDRGDTLRIDVEEVRAKTVQIRSASNASVILISIIQLAGKSF
jgi:environmental stress-induced protein Ves